MEVTELLLGLNEIKLVKKEPYTMPATVTPQSPIPSFHRRRLLSQLQRPVIRLELIIEPGNTGPVLYKLGNRVAT